jgi:threonine dehydratase
MRWKACLARQQETGALLTHAYDQPEVLAGAGTMAAKSSSRAACPTRCWSAWAAAA